MSQGFSDKLVKYLGNLGCMFFIKKKVMLFHSGATGKESLPYKLQNALKFLSQKFHFAFSFLLLGDSRALAGSFWVSYNDLFSILSDGRNFLLNIFLQNTRTFVTFSHVQKQHQTERSPDRF